MTQAYWISPKGLIIPVEFTHADTIRHNLELFELTPEQLAHYEDHSSMPLMDRGVTRSTIFTSLFEKGWVRIRYRPREGAWATQTDILFPHVYQYVQQWARQHIASNPQSSDDKVFGLDKGATHIWGEILYSTSTKLSSVAQHGVPFEQ